MAFVFGVIKAMEAVGTLTFISGMENNMDDLRNMTLADEFTELNRRIPETLAREHTVLSERAFELTAQFAGLPAVCDSDDLEREMTDLGVSLNRFLTAVETQRKSDKRVPLESPKLIDKFFADMLGSLPTRLDSLRSRVNTYKNQKAEAERKRLEEERRRALDEQREKDRIAREAMDRQRLETQESPVSRPFPPPEAPLSPPPAPAYVAPMVRTESGAKSGQRGNWVAKDIDRDTLDLNALRPLISMADLEKYANAYARQYKDTKPLAGARIVQEFNTTFRG
jgi:hypothetical protein